MAAIPIVAAPVPRQSVTYIPEPAVVSEHPGAIAQMTQLVEMYVNSVKIGLGLETGHNALGLGVLALAAPAAGAAAGAVASPEGSRLKGAAYGALGGFVGHVLVTGLTTILFENQRSSFPYLIIGAFVLGGGYIAGQKGTD